MLRCDKLLTTFRVVKKETFQQFMNEHLKMLILLGVSVTDITTEQCANILASGMHIGYVRKRLPYARWLTSH